MNAGEACCSHCGKPLFAGDNFCEGCGAKVEVPFSYPAGHAAVVDEERFVQDSVVAARTLGRIADYERLSAMLWIGLGGIQVLMGAIHGFKIALIIVGLWNIRAAYTRLKLPDLIRARSPGIPAMYEKQVLQLLIIGVLNLVLGGVIGVAFVVFDVVIRGMVLRNRALFVDEKSPPQES